VTQQNSAASEEMAATSEELASMAQQLQDTIAYFRLEANPAAGGRPRPQPTRGGGPVAHLPAPTRGRRGGNDADRSQAAKALNRERGVTISLESGAAADDLDAGYTKF